VTVSSVSAGPESRVAGRVGSGNSAGSLSVGVGVGVGIGFGVDVGGFGCGAGGGGATLPVQKEVCLLAPAHVNEKCMWSVCGFGPVYARHPDEAAYAPQIRLFQMTYWMPSRRATACRLPYLSLAKSHFVRSATLARPLAEYADTPQSQARPSLCSDRPPTLQARTMPRLRVPLYAARTRLEKSATPGLALGEQLVWGWYPA